MTIEIFPAARARIKEIRRYTKKLWGKEQANHYIRGLGKAIHQLAGQRNLWRPVEDEVLQGVFFIRCEHHYIFFREFKNHDIAIISVLHKSMDIPSRLKEDSNQT